MADRREGSVGVERGEEDMGARKSKAVREELQRRRKLRKAEGADSFAMRWRWEAIISKIPLDEKTTGVEVGVFHGSTARRVLLQRPLCTHIMVDPWQAPPAGSRWKESPGQAQHKSQEEFDKYYEEVKKATAVFGKRAVIIREYSVEAAKSFANSSLDYVFIDAEHTYEGVKEDVTAWLPKVKKGGWIGGHDYDNGRFVGVKRAVDELFQRDRIELNVDHTWFVEV